MTAITVRNLPPAVARAIRERAVSDGASMSRAVISLLGEATGRRPPRRAAAAQHDLDALAGSWSGRESVAFERALREQRTIDPRPWKRP
jgi:plasmid stability protein